MVATLGKHRDSALDVHDDGLRDAPRELECDLVTLENQMSDFNKCQSHSPTDISWGTFLDITSIAYFCSLCMLN